MPATQPLGLRAQIVLALSLVFLLAVWSLGFVTLQITRRSGEVGLRRSERSLASGIAPLLEREPAASAGEFEQLCEALRAHGGLAGMRVTRADGRVQLCGAIPNQRGSEIALPQGGRVQLALTPSRDPTSAAYVNLLLFYMA